MSDGGPDMLSEGQLALIKRAAALECEIERLEARLSRGEPVDLDIFGRAASGVYSKASAWSAVSGTINPDGSYNNVGALLEADFRRQQAKPRRRAESGF